MPTIYHAQIHLETYYLMYLILLFTRLEIVLEPKSPLTSYPPNGGRLPPGSIAKLLASRSVREVAMHPMMIEETIRAREEEVSTVAEQNRLVAIALDGQPGLSARPKALIRT